LQRLSLHATFFSGFSELNASGTASTAAAQPEAAQYH